MSYNQTFDIQSPAVARSYSAQFKPPSSINSHIQPNMHQANKNYETERRVQDRGPAGYQMPQSSPQIDWIIETLRQETSKHYETQLTLQSMRKMNLQLEQLLYQERTFNHALRVNIQETEIKRVNAEEKLRAYEQQNPHMASSPIPLSDYESTIFSPSINFSLSANTISSETSKEKRKIYLTPEATNSKRQKVILSPVGSIDQSEEE